MLDLMSFNFEVKIAGRHITLKKYTKTNQFNFTVKNPPSTTKRGESDKNRENFIKSIIRARKKVFDIIACNINCIPDYHGNIQRPKFWTLTFAENVTDLKTANAEFTKFNKRLSYYLYGVNKNVLKYICIPEFQKRGAVHFHVLYFNLPFIEQKEFSKIWGLGFTFVESVNKKEEIEDFAKYVAKYINKENSKGEDNYEIYLEKGLLNQKRYFVSRGLNKPDIFKLNIDKELYESFIAMLRDFHVTSHEYENEFIGKVEINNYEIENKSIKDMIINAINTIYKIMKSVYNKSVKVRYRDVEKMIDADTYYSIEAVMHKARIYYEKRQGVVV
ncbi:hypothetical protein SAMN02745883_02433 [Caminicella sporogenes DSM 14501]|uniref:Replication-associated protein ORF2/G2P domain-containing protein n=1 Tax=Caminicella sporogenes DSM 14501 TaxID=1121266 RepID=A0A1M6TSY2_9FIRM|nr:hypothetical protein [Caminicella sporogenes]RKD23756.1 hypothetical protein BET04_11980 [Caminicella sporogenes]SHK60057.1 hypothetical protein SAMN02745883_02433 [Caminicella sporogenes DSM 14501]